MDKQLLLYERAVPVSKEAHRGLSVDRGASFDFSAELNAVPLVAAEFGPAALEYPIVFTRDGDGPLSVAALLGLRDRNSFLGEDGGWTGRYVPAFLRRYPFVFAEANDRFILCIDEAYHGCNRDGRGAALFDDAGETGEYLQRMLDFTTSYQREVQATRAFLDRLAELDIIKPAAVEFTLAGARARTAGFHTVDRDRFAALPAETLSRLAKDGDLERIYAHLLSLRNVERFGGGG